MKHVKLYEEFLNEASVSQEAFKIHVITRNGQDAVQNFIDDNKIDGKKLLDYTLQNKGTVEELNIRDYIAGTGVGAEKRLLKNFIKRFK